VFPESREGNSIEQVEPVFMQPDQVKLRMLDIGICCTDSYHK